MLADGICDGYEDANFDDIQETSLPMHQSTSFNNMIKAYTKYEEEEVCTNTSLHLSG